MKLFCKARKFYAIVSVCNIGYYKDLNDNICLLCANGTFKSEVGNLECTECPEGGTTHKMGADQCGN